MTAITQGLKIIQIQRGSTLVDGDDVVDHIGRTEDAAFLAFLAERILLKLECPQAPPPPALVEVGVVVGKSREGFFLREPRALCMFLDPGHGYFFLRNIGRP